MSTIDSVKQLNTSQKVVAAGRSADQGGAGEAGTTPGPFSGFKKVFGDRQGLQNPDKTHDPNDNSHHSDPADTATATDTSAPTKTPESKQKSSESTSQGKSVDEDTGTSTVPDTAIHNSNSEDTVLPVVDGETIPLGVPLTAGSTTVENSALQEEAGTVLTDDPVILPPGVASADASRAGSEGQQGKIISGALPLIDDTGGTGGPLASVQQPANNLSLNDTENTLIASDTETLSAVVPVQANGRSVQAGSAKSETLAVQEVDQPDEKALREALNTNKNETGATDKTNRVVKEVAGAAASTLRTDASQAAATMQNTAVATESITPGTMTTGETSVASRSALTNELSTPRPQANGYPLMAANNTIKVMLNRGINSATVNLHPAELGSMRINLEMRADQLQVQIVAVQPATRDTIEAALPRLREQLESEGFTGVSIELGDGTTQDAPSERAGYQQAANEPVFGADSEPGLAVDSDSSNAVSESRNLVDLFA